MNSAPETSNLRAAFIEARSESPRGRLDSIQILRAIAVLMVALYHLTTLFPEPLAARWAIPGPLYFGYAGVDLFFVISGFIIMHVTRREPVDVGAFALKRIFRILPLYWGVTALLIGVWALHPAMVPIRADTPGQFFVESFLLVPTRERPLLGVGWTLEHEFQFYILVALLLVLGWRRLTLPFLMALFAGAVMLRVILDPHLAWWDWKIFSLYALEFGLGVIAYQFNARWKITRPWPLVLLAVAGFVVTSTLVTPLMDPDREVDVVARGAFGLLRVIGFGMSSFCLVLGALNSGIDEAPPSWPGRRLLIAIGDASYVIYLTHNLVLQFIAQITRHFAQPALVAVVGGAVALAAIVIVGVGLHRLVERPMLRFFEDRLIPMLIGRRVQHLSVAATGAEPTSGAHG